MPVWNMAHYRPSPDLALRLAIREAIVRLETARPLAPPPDDDRLTNMIGKLRAMLASFEPDRIPLSR
jgi:hypothetical protein